MSNRIVHFEIHSSDAEKTMKFYGDLFGWTFEKWPMEGVEYWSVMTAPKESKESGINGGLVKRIGALPTEGGAVNAFVCTVQVENLDEIVGKAIKIGGVLALPKMAIPGMAWLAYCKDNEGNIFRLFQEDKEAK